MFGTRLTYSGTPVQLTHLPTGQLMAKGSFMVCAQPYDNSQTKLLLPPQPLYELSRIPNICVCFCNWAEVWTATFVFLRREENDFFSRVFTAQMLLMKRFMFTHDLTAPVKYSVCSGNKKDGQNQAWRGN